MFKNYVLSALLIGSGIFSSASAQTVITAGSVNGVLNPTQYAGSDIGAKVNTAWKSGRTVRIPAGNYTFTTTIVHPGAGYELQCDAGAVLSYTGSSDAIVIGNASNPRLAGIDGEGGCVLQGTASAQSGIHIQPSGHVFVRNILIYGFNNANYGYGIYDTGGNSIDITNVDIFQNNVGIYLTGATQNGSGYAANAVHVAFSHITSNATWGIVSEDSFCACTQNLGNVFSSNHFEANGSGDLYLDWEYGTTVSGNYFESNGINVEIGNAQNTWGVSVVHNYFTAGGGNPSNVTIGYGSHFNIEENAQLGNNTATGCFINVVTGSGGGSLNKHGVGTNQYISQNEWCNHGVGTTSP